MQLLISNTIDQNKIEEILGRLQSIEQLLIYGNFSYFNLDDFVNLKSLNLTGTFNDDFNFDMLKQNLCVQLEYLTLFQDSNKRGDERIIQLLNDLQFPSLQHLIIINFNVRKVTKKFIDQYPMLRYLIIRKCNVDVIEDDAFANLKKLVYLDLNENLLTTLKKEHFSQLINLNCLILRNNRLGFIDSNVFTSLKNLRTLDLCLNKLSRVNQKSLIKTLFKKINLIEIFVYGNNK